MNAVVQPTVGRGDPAGSEPFEEVAKTSSVPNERLAANEATNAASRRWIERLAHLVRPTAGEPDTPSQGPFSCELRSRRPMLFLPPEMRSRQPASLAWLRGFARRHGFGLAENRHRADVPPTGEREPGALALGIGQLLSQGGMSSGSGEGTCTPSSSARLAADAPHPTLDELVRMAAHARPGSKRAVLLPNPSLVAANGGDTHPIVAHACRLSTPTFRTVLSQFDSPSFRGLGYASGGQYVVHVLLAGGLAAAPELWTRLQMLTGTDFHFGLFPGGVPSEDVGLFHATFHYDVANEGGVAGWAAKAVGRSA